MAELTLERLREVLEYDPESGEFIYRKGAGCMRAGSLLAL